MYLSGFVSLSLSRGGYTFQKVKVDPIIEQISICLNTWVYSMKYAPQPAKSNIGQPLLNPNKLYRPTIGMWGVYPEAMACNVSGLCSDIHLGERILI